MSSIVPSAGYAVRSRFFGWTVGLTHGWLLRCAGAGAVFPLDYAKTRMQMDTTGAYRNLGQTFSKIAADSGVASLYRGLVPNIVGIIPEKTLKLVGNDLWREYFKVDDVTVYPEGNLLLEAAAGGLAGFGQTIATTPMEITKIRMQMYKAPPGESPSQLKILTEMVSAMGLRGMYQGMTSTIMRDVPFSLVFFGSYGVFRRKLADPDTGKIGSMQALQCSFVAGTLGAAISTPLDVIKTRIQGEVKPGVKPYVGYVSTVKRIAVEEVSAPHC